MLFRSLLELDIVLQRFVAQQFTDLNDAELTALDTVVGDDALGLVEPEMGNLREHLALARNAVGHDAIEGGDAVGGYQQQAVAEIKHFADLAAFDFRDAG